MLYVVLFALKLFDFAVKGVIFLNYLAIFFRLSAERFEASLKFLFGSFELTLALLLLLDKLLCTNGISRLAC